MAIATNADVKNASVSVSVNTCVFGQDYLLVWVRSVSCDLRAQGDKVEVATI